MLQLGFGRVVTRCDRLSARVEMSPLPRTSNAQFLSVLEELCGSIAIQTSSRFSKESARNV